MSAGPITGRSSSIVPPKTIVTETAGASGTPVTTGASARPEDSSFTPGNVTGSSAALTATATRRTPLTQAPALASIANGSAVMSRDGQVHDGLGLVQLRLI